MHRILEQEKHSQILEDIREVEKQKNDSGKMYAAIRILQKKKKRTQMVITSENGMTTDEHTQVRIITGFYKKQFNRACSSGILEATPQDMKMPFTQQEIQKAIKKLKNNKSPGIDKIRAEHLKNGPDLIPKIIADILNQTASTGNNPMEIKLGILNPLIKNILKQGPCTNLRPIILLSILRKILAICMIERIGDKIQQHIPHSQAAYQKGRSTTEHVFTYKLLAEKAISSASYTVHVLLMDLSKAFDTINRETLINDLKNILEPDEVHMMKILLEGVQYQIKVGNTIGDAFQTNTGSPQGDCLSAILFAFYLAATLEYEVHMKHHQYALPRHLQNKIPIEIHEHNYYISEEKAYKLCKQTLNVDTQYADDCGNAIIGNDKHQFNYIKKTVPALLQKRQLLCNETKNEEHKINHANRFGSWRKCKYLGTLLGTKEDFKRRKMIAMESIKSLKQIWESTLQISLKMRIFDCLVRSVFMYNSELWAITKSIRSSINSTQRKLLRIAINIKYTQIISNERLMIYTKQTPWTKIIDIQRIRWLGHLFRLPEECPARIAMNEFERSVPRPIGHPLTTWVSIVKKQLLDVGIHWETAKQAALDRVLWRDVLKFFQ